MIFHRNQNNAENRNRTPKLLEYISQDPTESKRLKTPLKKVNRRKKKGESYKKSSEWSELYRVVGICMAINGNT